MASPFHDLKRAAEEFYERRRIPGPRYGAHAFMPGKKATYWASAYAVLARSLTGGLEDLDPGRKKEWLEFFLDGQDEETGFFKEPLVPEDLFFKELHDEKSIFWHGATFALGAIHLLGGIPRYPVKAMEALRNPARMKEWLENLPWQDPWKAGNWTYDLGCLMGADYLVTGDDRNLEAMEAFFDWHDACQDPGTGWWDPFGKKELHQMQFGGYHTLMVYWMYDRQEKMPEEMIKSSLLLQSENGSFRDYGCCGDMDVIDTVVSLSRSKGIMHREVKKAAEKFLPYLTSLYKDKGFLSKPDFVHSDLCWNLHKGEENVPDPCSTYFRLFTLSLVNEVLDLEELRPVRWRHMDGYCHGIRPRRLLKSSV